MLFSGALSRGIRCFGNGWDAALTRRRCGASAALAWLWCEKSAANKRQRDYVEPPLSLLSSGGSAASPERSLPNGSGQGREALT